LQENEIAALRAQLYERVGSPIQIVSQSPTENPDPFNNQMNFKSRSPSDFGLHPLLGQTGAVAVSVGTEKALKRSRKGRANKKETT
jgi:hypothetical protein